jgi:hypothetical protein
MGSSGSASGDYLSFSVAEGVTQYFIRPLEFNSEGEEGEIDFTFRDGKGDVDIDTVTANFTLVSTTIRKTLDSLHIATDSTDSRSLRVITLYTEAKGDMVKSRYSAKLLRSEFFKLFHNPEWKIAVYSPSGSVSYKTPASTQRTVANLYRNLIRIAEAPSRSNASYNRT